jgi:hypothetical protein
MVASYGAPHGTPPVLHGTPQWLASSLRYKYCASVRTLPVVVPWYRGLRVLDVHVYRVLVLYSAACFAWRQNPRWYCRFACFFPNCRVIAARFSLNATGSRWHQPATACFDPQPPPSPRTMSKKFQKQTTVATETARDTERGLKKEQRGMDRERRKLEGEEKKLIAKIKECHKKNDLASAKVYGACRLTKLLGRDGGQSTQHGSLNMWHCPVPRIRPADTIAHPACCNGCCRGAALLLLRPPPPHQRGI